MYDFKGHKSIQEFISCARYVIEMRKEVYFRNGQMIEIEWPDSPSHKRSTGSISTQKSDGQDWEDYRTQYYHNAQHEEEWANLIDQLIVGFRNHLSLTNSPIKATGITKRDGISITGPQTRGYSRSKPRPIQVYNIGFNSEIARQAFLDYVDSKGYIESVVIFLEIPQLGKTKWKPTPTI